MTNKPVIVITGASRGLGAAVTRWLAKAGAGFTLIARSEEKLGQTAETARQLGGDPLIQKADLSDPDACRAAVIKTLEYFGRLDALVNNAGIVQPITSVAKADPIAWLALYAPAALSGKLVDYDDPRISRPAVETFGEHLESSRL